MSDPSALHPDDLAELALGIEDPGRRPLLVAHVARCRTCRESLAELADVADGLAALAPPAEPAAGFEQRVLGRVPARTAPEARRRVAWWVPVAAAAAAVAAAVPLTLSAAGHGRPGTQTVALTSARGPVGDVVVDGGPSPWLSMWVRGWSGDPLTCQVVTRTGTVVTIGVFVPGPHGGYWAAPIPPPARPATAARLVDRSGRVVAVARLG